MKYLPLILLLLFPVPVFAQDTIKMVKVWNYLDQSNPDGDHMGCRTDTMDHSNSGLATACYVPPGYTLEITMLGVAVWLDISLQGVGVLINNNGTDVAESEIEINDPGGSLPDDCEADNLSGGVMDQGNEYCRQNLNITISENEYWYVATNRNDGANDDLYALIIWVEGTLTRN